MPGMLQAHTTRPSFGGRQSIAADDLRQISDPCVIFEADWLDDNGERVYAYTVGGWLNGQPLGGLGGGVTVGGEVMLVHGRTRGDADALASMGLQDTIDALNAEQGAYIDAQAALARLATVGAIDRMDMATANPADTSEQFVHDTQAIRRLRGDDIVLTTGGVEDAPG